MDDHHDSKLDALLERSSFVEVSPDFARTVIAEVHCRRRNWRFRRAAWLSGVAAAIVLCVLVPWLMPRPEKHESISTDASATAVLPGASAARQQVLIGRVGDRHTIIVRSAPGSAAPAQHYGAIIRTVGGDPPESGPSTIVVAGRIGQGF